MAVKDFKNIDTRTSFRVLEKDRTIIERGKRLSNFGSGKEDFIEFTLYDIVITNYLKVRVEN